MPSWTDLDPPTSPRPTDHLEAALTHLDSSDLGAITWYFDRLLASSSHPQVQRLIRALAATTAAELAARRELPQDPPGPRGIFGNRP